ncbi:MAG: hypothetical protein KJ626_14655, partial [Verrucomicrobia bacterium]|nr:hypothetical protein [Verrucomicrobiota bacterium]
NGVQIRETNIVLNIRHTSTNPRIGATADAVPSLFYPGVMDEVRVYNRGLGSNEVWSLYESGASSAVNDYYLDTAAGAGGSVDTDDGWYTNNAAVSITAIPDTNYMFNAWTGDVPGGSETNNPLVLMMDSNRTVTATFEPANVNAGLVLYYAFATDEGGIVTDLSGRGNTGAVHGATWTVEGLSSGAYQFVRSEQDYIAASNSPSLDITDALTMTAWIKIPPSSIHERIVSKLHYTGPADNGGFSMQLANSGKLQATVANDEVAYSIATSVLDDDAWHFVAATYSGSEMKLYVDGSEEAISAQNGVLPAMIKSTARPFYVGRVDEVGSYFGNGLIDEVKIHDRALSSNEVSALYAAGSSNLPVWLDFVVDGWPVNADTPSPYPYGTNTVLAGTPVTESVTSPTTPVGGLRYISTAWLGTGDVPLFGQTTTVSFVLTQPSSITWNWVAQYYLDTAAGHGGTVNVGDGWHKAGSNITITATADTEYSFDQWVGDVPAGQESVNPLTVTMDQARTIQARFSADSLETGLLLYYSFDKNDGTVVTDDSGNGNTGVVSGASWSTASAVGVGAYSFDGSNDYVVSSNFVPTLGSTFTVVAWIKPTGPGSPYPYSGFLGLSSNFNFGYNYNGVNFDLWDFANDASPGPWYYGYDIRGQWGHIALVYEGTQQSLYVDGKYKGARSINPALPYNGGGNLNVGAAPQSPQFFKGLVDEVRIYERPLASNEVLELYQEFGNRPHTPCDFDADGITDIGIYRPSTMTWFIYRSQAGFMTPFAFGAPGDIPIPADYDGDGISDVAVFRPSTMTWYVYGTSVGAFPPIVFGAPGDVPVPADFDGDMVADFAVLRPTTMTWYIFGSATGAFPPVSYGGLGDQPIPADYDGDWRADLGIFRPFNGAWIIRGSTDGMLPIIPYGITGDIPIPGDYDGDGLADKAVFRPSTLRWYIHGTSAGAFTPFVFGAPGDRPLM